MAFSTSGPSSLAGSTPRSPPAYTARRPRICEVGSDQGECDASVMPWVLCRPEIMSPWRERGWLLDRRRCRWHLPGARLRHRPCAVGPALAGAPPLPMRAAVLIPNGACRGLRFAPRTSFSSKRRGSAPSHLGDSAVLGAKVRPRSTSSKVPGGWLCHMLTSWVASVLMTHQHSLVLRVWMQGSHGCSWPSVLA